MEDLRFGQRIANYSIEYLEGDAGSKDWRTLVPVLHHRPDLGDRPDGHDPRDAYVGHKRIDFPQPSNGTISSTKVAKIRFSCHRSLQDPVSIRKFSVHKKIVPW